MLAVARSLSSHDVSFVVVGLEPRSVVGSSRFVRGKIVGPSPASSLPDTHAEFILEVARRYGVQVVMPLTDSTLAALDRHREDLEQDARLAAAPSPAIRNVLDKRANLDTARRLGVPCPAQFELESLEQVPELIDRLGFPVVLKNPGRHLDDVTGAQLDFKWLVAGDESELRRYLAEHCSSGEFPLFQQLATGTVRNVCCFVVGGEILALHEYWGIRRWRGVSVFRQITPLAPELRRYAEAILGELHWDGVAHLGFFVRPDGDVRYMETNGRFWASLEGSVAAGWDFPYWTYRYFAQGERPDPVPPSLGVGRISRWHAGDLAALVSFLAGEQDPSWSGRTRSRALVEYLSGFRPGIHPDVFRFDDPVPEFVEHWQGGRVALAQLRHRWMRRARRAAADPRGASLGRLLHCAQYRLHLTSDARTGQPRPHGDTRDRAECWAAAPPDALD